MKIYIGADHAGFELKEDIVKFLLEKGFEVEDKGAYKLDPEDDYPDFITPVAQEVSKDKDSLGIVIGGSGQGEAIVANRIKGIRATVYYGGKPEIISLSKEHNNSNVLSLGARFLETEEAKEAVSRWIETDFSGDDRHVRRLQKID